jgi:hypothetical protein
MQYQLLKYVKSNNIKGVKRLLARGANINYIYGDGYTLLMWAINSTGNIELVKLLIDCKADINITNKNNHTALSLVAMYGETELVKLLIDSGANVNTNSFMSPLDYAISYIRNKTVLLLLENGAKTNHPIQQYQSYFNRIKIKEHDYELYEQIMILVKLSL